MKTFHKHRQSSTNDQFLEINHFTVVFWLRLGSSFTYSLHVNTVSASCSSWDMTHIIHFSNTALSYQQVEVWQQLQPHTLIKGTFRTKKQKRAASEKRNVPYQYSNTLNQCLKKKKDTKTIS